MVCLDIINSFSFGQFFVPKDLAMINLAQGQDAIAYEIACIRKVQQDQPVGAPIVHCI
jgi:hypothetical protein